MDQELERIYKNAGFTGTLSIGKKVGVLVIDFQIGFTDPSQSPLASDFSSELMKTVHILRKAREKKVPIFFVGVGYRNIREGGVFIKKVPSLQQFMLGSPLVELDPRLERRLEEPFLIKKYASAFAGTSLASLLVSEGIDTLFITGVTTSGCVRASVVDAIQHGFIPFVVSDAVGDRARVPHESNLFDIASKYGEITNTDNVLYYLSKI
ncbi:isochorismatase family protein [Geobacillus sp. Y412MC52]|uniref:isochorismatase family protein n=1 Tax=Geobacillus sp. (strain Y412MC52) TaxID=550542 RepID=UPI00018C1A8B|nr:isochorismatase family protein [Geobacillus sp. Y412MC52]ADU95963.1 isochorismatase hydrolase [Geobacillus sp. Y412MC52]